MTMAEKKPTKTAKAKAEAPVMAFMDEAAIADSVARRIYKDIAMLATQAGGRLDIGMVYLACKKHMVKE